MLQQLLGLFDFQAAGQIFDRRHPRWTHAEAPQAHAYQEHKAAWLARHFSAERDTFAGRVTGLDDGAEHTQDGGRERFAKMAHLRIIAVCRHEVLHEIVRADGNEIHGGQERIHGDRRRGNFHHHADRCVAKIFLLGFELAAGPIDHTPQAPHLFQCRDHGKHQPDFATQATSVGCGPQDGPNLCHEKLGMFERQPDTSPA